MAERWWWELGQPLADVKAGEPYQVTVQREAIPVIFLPGAMGSRLRQRVGRKLVWDPDREHGVWMLRKYGLFWQRGGKKKRNLVGDTYREDFLEVALDDDGRLPPRAEDDDEGPVERGWGGVMWSTYGGVIRRLAAPETWLAHPRVGLFFDLPVYAHGYNWTADVGFAARTLAERIDGIIRRHASRKCRQVILVTHSMGGLVARAACALPGVGAKVLGVVHGVQPVHGSAAAYWRMKGGFERDGLAPSPAAWVLGTDGKEVTQTMSEMPGGLTLLPNRLYGSEWLEFFDFEENRVRRLPEGDPYEEIYREKERYWRLVDPGYLIGETTQKSERKGRTIGMAPRAPWNIYLANLETARQAHAVLERNLQHPETHYFMGTKLKTAGRIGFDRSRCIPGPEGDLPTPGLVHHRDGFATVVRQGGGTLWRVVMERPDDDGDGTVPSGSAGALEQQGESQSFELEGRAGAPGAFERMEHQPAYEEREVQEYTVDAVRRLCLLRMKRGGP